jgi:hypothetical protein
MNGGEFMGSQERPGGSPERTEQNAPKGEDRTIDVVSELGRLATRASGVEKPAKK